MQLTDVFTQCEFNEVPLLGWSALRLNDIVVSLEWVTSERSESIKGNASG